MNNRILSLSFAVCLALIAPACIANTLSREFVVKVVNLPDDDYLDSEILDLNGDGIADLAALADRLGLQIKFGDGAGNFSPARSYDTEGFFVGLAFGDFNGDGFPDAVVVRNGSIPGLDVLLNDGAGGFPNLVHINAGETPLSVAVADFNRDGKLDIAETDFTSSSIFVLLGDGNGGFATPVVVPAATGPAGLVAADFDGDGVLDLVTGGYRTGGLGELQIFKGVGDGSFQALASYPLVGTCNDLVQADFNQDGKLDIVLGDSQVTVFLGDGEGGFVQSALLAGGASYTMLAAADINGNGQPDVLFSNGPYLGVALGHGDGTFGAVHQTKYPGRFGSFTLAVGDINNDGRIDAFMAHGGRSVVLLNVR